MVYPICLSSHFLGLPETHVTRPRLPVGRGDGGVLDGGEDMHGSETKKRLSCQDAECKPGKLQCGVIRPEMGIEAGGERGLRGAFEP